MKIVIGNFDREDIFRQRPPLKPWRYPVSGRDTYHLFGNPGKYPWLYWQWQRPSWPMSHLSCRKFLKGGCWILQGGFERFFLVSQFWLESFSRTWLSSKPVFKERTKMWVRFREWEVLALFWGTCFSVNVNKTWLVNKSQHQSPSFSETERETYGTPRVFGGCPATGTLGGFMLYPLLNSEETSTILL